MTASRASFSGSSGHAQVERVLQPIIRQLDSLISRQRPSSTLVLEAQPPQRVVRLLSTPPETQTLAQLVRSDLAEHRQLSRVILTLASLVTEIESLVNEARTQFYRPLVLYGATGVESASPGASILSLARILPLLQKVSDFQEHCQRVMLNLFQQLAIFYGSEPTKVGLPAMDNKEVHFQVVFDHLGRLLVTLITLDGIIQTHASLGADWIAYRELVDRASSESRERPGINELVTQLKRLDEKLFGAGLFLVRFLHG